MRTNLFGILAAATALLLLLPRALTAHIWLYCVLAGVVVALVAASIVAYALAQRRLVGWLYRFLSAASGLVLLLPGVMTGGKWFLLIVGTLAVTSIVASIIAYAQRPRPPDNLSETHIRQALQRGDRNTAVRWYCHLHGVELRQALAGIKALEAQERSIDETSKRGA